ncbi:MAG: M20 family metallopeptidase [Thermomicrobiales bacterium]
MSDPIVAHLEKRLDAYLAELAMLVNQDSGSYDKAGVDIVTGKLAERLRSMGFAVERVPQTAFGDDLVARRQGQGRGRIMLLGHADTVFPAGTTAERPMSIVGGKVMGPGTCDMKAGLMTGVYAIEALDAIDWGDYETITFVIVSDEEIGERHSVDLLTREGARHDAIFTLEAARENGDVVTARKAGCWYTVEAFGKAAHAGVEPEKGRSATVAIAHVIVDTFQLNGLKPGMIVNPGEISGGRAPNIVSDYATAHFDLRAWTNADLEDLASAFVRAAEAQPVPDVRIVAGRDPGAGCPAMERTAGVIRLEEMAVSIANELGFPLKGAATGGGSDISFAGQAGTPGLDGLGPVGGLDHGPDEYVDLNSIVPRTALLARLIQGACGGAGARNA